jgi:hypothetical protein
MALIMGCQRASAACNASEPGWAGFFLQVRWRVTTCPVECGVCQWPSGTVPAFTGPSRPPQSGRRAFDSRLAPVASAELCLLESSARREFKRMAGQNNHFLIPILVGLAAVESGTAVLPDGMRVSWAPHDRASSAARSREFATKALLAWLADALSAYARALGRPPSIANAAVEVGICTSQC